MQAAVYNEEIIGLPCALFNSVLTAGIGAESLLSMALLLVAGVCSLLKVVSLAVFCATAFFAA